MIRVRIELIPGGVGEPTEIGRIDIWNDLSSYNLRNKGNYRARLYTRGSAQKVWKTAEVTGFPRKRLGPYDLLYRVLRGVVGERNQGTG